MWEWVRQRGQVVGIRDFVRVLPTEDFRDLAENEAEREARREEEERAEWVRLGKGLAFQTRRERAANSPEHWARMEARLPTMIDEAVKRLRPQWKTAAKRKEEERRADLLAVVHSPRLPFSKRLAAALELRPCIYDLSPHDAAAVRAILDATEDEPDGAGAGIPARSKEHERGGPGR
jgi:hypothetical protein